MNHEPATPPPATAHPLYFDVAGSWCFGWYHPPATDAHDLVVVICQPIGYEAVCAYPSLVQLSRALAAAGLPVLRFDYLGTGDSAGDDTEPGRLEAWTRSTEAAVQEAIVRSGASRVALLGVRLGALLAVEAAHRVHGVDSLVLWAPCTNAKAFVRELRACGQDDGAGGLVALGHRYTEETLGALSSWVPSAGDPAPAKRALVIGRDDFPGEGPWPRALEGMGVPARFCNLPGYSAMMQEPRAGVLEGCVFGTLAQWLQADRPRKQLRPEAVPSNAGNRVNGGVRELPLRMGCNGLFGILSEPCEHTAPEQATQTAIILLNVGGNHRIGPHRIYVEMARRLAVRGYRVLRLDLAGIGDSPPVAGAPYGDLYSKDSTHDVRAAIDTLQALGSRNFVLMGICSGSYVAFQTALVDDRVNAQVLMNSRLLEWHPGRPGDTWAESMQQYAKSTDFYIRSLCQLEVWKRLALGKVHVRAIARRLFSIAQARLSRAWALCLGRPVHDGLLGKMRQLCERSLDTLMLVADADDGRDYVEFHFGRLGSRLRNNSRFKMKLVPAADHTFSRPASRDFMIEAVLTWLSARASGQPSAKPKPARGVAPVYGPTVPQAETL